MKVCSVCLRCFEDTNLSCSEENHGALTEARLGSCELIDGYRLEFLVEVDEIGETYEAINTASNQSCFINLTAANLVENNQELQSNFLRESRIAAEINHPGLVRIFESGTLSDGSLFVISEFAAGQTLSERLNSGNEISEISAVAIAKQTAEALEAIHSFSINHRNINPQNIILSADAENSLLIKIRNIDFGGIRQRFVASGISDSEAVLNNLKYFSPEQCAREKAIDASTDIYSLGIVLYEILAGNVPFDAPNAEELIHKQINQTAAPVQISNFDIRALLTHTLSLSLQKTIIARLKSANAFARQLRHIEQYASRSFSPAVSERILTDEKVKAQSDNRNNQMIAQIKENASPANLINTAVLTEPKTASSLIEKNEELISVIKNQEIASFSPAAQKTSVVEPENVSVDEPEIAAVFQDTKPVLVEWEQPQDILAESDAAKVLSEEFHQQTPQPQLVTIEEAEKYLDDQMESLLDLDEPESAPDLSLQIEKETDDEPDNRYNVNDIWQLISVRDNKIYLGGGAALLLLILIGAFFSRQFSSDEKQTIVATPPKVSEPQETSDSKVSVSQPETSEETTSGDETAVVEMPDLPDSKTFAIEENQPVTEKTIPVISKSVNQNPPLKESAGASRTNLKKSAAISKEKTVNKTNVTQNAFPDIKIIIGNRKPVSAKPASAKPDVFSRPRIVKKDKSLRVF